MCPASTGPSKFKDLLPEAMDSAAAGPLASPDSRRDLNISSEVITASHANGHVGSLADLLAKFSLMSAFECKADFRFGEIYEIECPQTVIKPIVNGCRHFLIPDDP